MFSKKKLRLANPISSDLDTLRTSGFSNILIHSKNNVDRGYKNLMLFEVGPNFIGTKPGEQQVVATAMKMGNKVEKSWIEKSNLYNVFDIKSDLLLVLADLGISAENLIVENKVSPFFHPGRSGAVYLGSNKGPLLATFGELHPNVVIKLELEKYSPCGFEIYLDNIQEPKKKQREKKVFEVSKFQVVERDFAFIVSKDIKANQIISTIKNINPTLIKSINIFDVYEGENIDNNSKSIALNIKLQSMKKIHLLP